MDIVKRQQILQAYRELPVGELTALVKQSQIDPLPFVLQTEEIHFLKSAVAQWGRTLTKVYRDLWGSQELLAQRALDPRQLWGITGYDPAFYRVVPESIEPLSLFRLDLVRSPQGIWLLQGLGTDVVRGLGEALQTRVVHGRTAGPLLPHDNVVRMAPFFQGLKDLWFAESPTHKDEPTIMIWTLGPSDARYFEPAYLSRYFGYPLVESRDLTVRSGKVFLKTLGGLQNVDVLIRMVPDASFDPLLGNPGGWGGVAGLAQAVRDGTVMVTNGPGSGLLEQPALLPAFPALARAVGEGELLLPPQTSAVEAGTEDHFESGQWSNAPIGIRLYGLRLASGWELLPGGTVQRLAQSQFLPEIFEGTKKDLWFLSEQAVAAFSLLPTGERPSEITRGADLPSRVADDLFWLGRYTERAWFDLRFLEKQGQLRAEAGEGFLKTLLGKLEILNDNHSRLTETIGEIHRISGQVLDRLSLETHRILKEFGPFLLRKARIPSPGVLRQLNLRLAAFTGLTLENTTRNSGWRFLDMGRRVERATLLVEALQTWFKLDVPGDKLALLLDVFDCTLTYRTRYRLSPQRGPVLDLLLLDETNPRSLAFQLETLAQHVEQLPRAQVQTHRTREARIILEMSTLVQLADALELDDESLGNLLGKILTGLESFAESLHQVYLAKIDAMESIQAREQGIVP